MTEAATRMQCMEIWGGNEPARRRVATPGLQVEVLSRPAGGSAGGGDLHFVSSCASGRITRFVLADVSGHGEAVAAVARDVRDLMRRSINHVDQTRFVASLNRRIAEIGGGELFATAIVGTFFVTTRRLSLCNAGHPPPLLRRRGDDRWTPLPTAVAEPGEIANIPLGIIPRIPYRETVLRLAPGDRLLACTDAAAESRDAAGSMLGTDGLGRLLAELDDAARHPEASPDRKADLLDRLDEALAARRGQPADDDETLLLLAGDATASRWRDTLLAPLRIAAEVIGPRRPAAT
jgi:sigma-B regulation protein RsbU (phosphoserine phosphatase)